LNLCAKVTKLLVNYQRKVEEISNLNTKNVFWSELPMDILREIFSYIGVRSLCRASTVCKKWQKVALQDYLWIPIASKWTVYSANAIFLKPCHSYQLADIYEKKKEFLKISFEFALNGIDAKTFGFIWKDKNCILKLIQKFGSNSSYFQNFISKTPTKYLEFVLSVIPKEIWDSQFFSSVVNHVVDTKASKEIFQILAKMSYHQMTPCNPFI
jgi:hypothetical protein